MRTESGHQVTETAEEEDQEEECHDLDEEENDIVSWCWDPLAPPDQWEASIKRTDQLEASIKSIDQSEASITWMLVDHRHI